MILASKYNNSRKAIAYKVVQYIYEKKGDMGLLMKGFNNEQDAINYKLQLIQETKFEKLTHIYMIEPVYQYFNFISFLTQTV